MCLKPFEKGSVSFGCGQCMPCRVNRSRLWVGRLMLERMSHQLACFVTLTYSEEHVPKSGHLEKRALQLFIKRLREDFHPRTIRYYAVGEYGDKNWRPHFHILLFGVSPVESDRVNKAWGFGFVHVGTAEQSSISYCCGYIVKKMTNPKDKRLQGRPPEFALMSKKPGIGTGALLSMEEAYKTEAGQAALQANGWIINKMRTQGLKYPMGKYLERKLAEKLALTPEQRSDYLAKVYAEAASRRPSNKKQWAIIKKSRRAAEAGKYQRKDRLL